MVEKKKPDTRPLDDVIDVVDRALLYVLQLSDKAHKQTIAALGPLGFIRALEQDGYTIVSDAENIRIKRQAHLAYLYLNVVNCPRCHLPSAQGLVCPCGYDGAD